MDQEVDGNKADCRETKVVGNHIMNSISQIFHGIWIKKELWVLCTFFFSLGLHWKASIEKMTILL